MVYNCDIFVNVLRNCDEAQEAGCLVQVFESAGNFGLQGKHKRMMLTVGLDLRIKVHRLPKGFQWKD